MDTSGDKSNDRALPQQQSKQPDDRAPAQERDHLAGQSASSRAEADRELPMATAYDVDEVHRRLADRFTDDELKQIPILREGARLEQGATYADIAAPSPHEVHHTGGVAARRGELFVPKDRVPHGIWNRLVGERKPGQR